MYAAILLVCCKEIYVFVKEIFVCLKQKQIHAIEYPEFVAYLCRTILIPFRFEVKYIFVPATEIAE